MKDDITVDRAKFDALLKKMLDAKPLPLSKLKGEEPNRLAARKPRKVKRTSE